MNVEPTLCDRFAKRFVLNARLLSQIPRVDAPTFFEAALETPKAVLKTYLQATSRVRGE
jgi:hypothetical protein